MNEVYEAGKFYTVPCVRVPRTYFIEPGKATVWVAVAGPDHADADIGIKENHYHADWRFMSESLLAVVFPDVFNSDTGYRFRGRKILTYWIGDAELRRKRCVRSTFEFPFHPEFAKKIERACAGMRLKPGCVVCPHRGVPLTGPVDAEGRTVCPGHGLQWNLNTGEIASRIPAVR